MTNIDITLTLPDDLAREADTLGLLTSLRITQLVRAELTRRRTDPLFVLMDRLAATPKQDLTEADLQAEIEDYRREKREANEGRS